jgi:N-6 DNA Methylase
MARRTDAFVSIRSEGGLLPPSLLSRVAAGDPSLPGVTPKDYHLAGNERTTEMISRSWNRLTGAWLSFQDARARLPEGDPAGALTRDRWLYVLFSELGYGPLEASHGLTVNGRAFPISHEWRHSPIHLVGAGISLDEKTPGVAGAARSSPHSLVQELLNASEERLWGVVSNGLTLRLLRDNATLTRTAYLEFDLQSMMRGEVYSDFVLLWLCMHESRLEGEPPSSCWLERWYEEAEAQGTRALDHLRQGVEEAIRVLGRGFLLNSANHDLRLSLTEGGLTEQNYYRELLRLVYRLIFLFVAEDRGLLLSPGPSDAASERYLTWYSTERLRRLAARRRGSLDTDLFRGLSVVMTALGSDSGQPALRLPALGSRLWSSDAVGSLARSELSNRDLLDAVRALAVTQKDKVAQRTDFRNLGSEELGSVYESLLELHPQVGAAAGTFELSSAAGNERKTTGSYYTPTSLISALLDSALDPVLEVAATGQEPEQAILSLRVVDPACGSGHFLIAAAHRIARRLAGVRTGDLEPAPPAIRSALRDVIGSCVYGVDMNEMAVELCKVSLWLEAIDPGRPLSFLDHHIVLGNSLLGTTPALLAKGIPDDAFKPIEGDEKAIVSSLRARNKSERSGQLTIEFSASPTALVAPLAREMGAIAAINDESLAGVREREETYARLVASTELSRARAVADAWCAAFVGAKDGAAPTFTQEVIHRLDVKPEAAAVQAAYLEALRSEFGFFHWHLAFPDVFTMDDAEPPTSDGGWRGGFDVVLSNPPWERVKLQEQEWFAERAPEIAALAGATRKRRIAGLHEEDPSLYEAYLEAVHKAEALSHFLRNSGRFPLCGRGDVNTYSVFAELMRSLISPDGRAGMIVPTGIATDDITKDFFASLVDRRQIVSLFDFENAKPLFVGVHRSYKFCLLTVGGGARPEDAGADFMFFAHDTTDLADPERQFQLNAADFKLLNPNTRTCPIFRTRRDAEIVHRIYERVPVLIDQNRPDGNPWGIKFQRMFDMTNDSQSFRRRNDLEAEGFLLEGNVFKRGEERWLPLYEGKMFSQYDHRAADVVLSPTALLRQGQPQYLDESEHADPDRVVTPQYWISEGTVLERLNAQGAVSWLLAFMNVTSPTNERTVIASALPVSGVAHSAPLIFVGLRHQGSLSFLLASLNSLALDYIARQKLGGVNLTYFIIEQLAMLSPDRFEQASPWDPEISVGDWLTPRLLELVYTASDIVGFAETVGFSGPPFRWDSERRLRVRSEIDACFLHLYGFARADVEHVLTTFPGLARNEVERYGNFRYRDLILDAFDGLAAGAQAVVV